MHSVFLPLALPAWKPGGGIDGIGNLSKLLYAPIPPIELKCMFEWEKTWNEQWEKRNWLELLKTFGINCAILLRPLVMFGTASYFAYSFHDSYQNLKFIRFFVVVYTVTILSIVKRRITLLIHLWHKQVVVGLILGLLLLLGVELRKLTERDDGRIDPIGVAVVETYANWIELIELGNLAWIPLHFALEGMDTRKHGHLYTSMHSSIKISMFLQPV